MTGKKYEVYDKSGGLLAYGWHYAPISYKALEKELKSKNPESGKIIIAKI